MMGSYLRVEIANIEEEEEIEIQDRINKRKLNAWNRVKKYFEFTKLK